jgi:hypothetical protein
MLNYSVTTLSAQNFIVAKQNVEQKLIIDQESNSPTPISPILLYFQRLIYLRRDYNVSWYLRRPFGQLLINKVEQNIPTKRSCDLRCWITYKRSTDSGRNVACYSQFHVSLYLSFSRGIGSQLQLGDCRRHASGKTLFK